MTNPSDATYICAPGDTLFCVHSTEPNSAAGALVAPS
jgi:hypothetical protein